MKKVTNSQSIRANKISNIKDTNLVGVICATTTSVKDRLDTVAMADLVAVIVPEIHQRMGLASVEVVEY